MKRSLILITLAIATTMTLAGCQHGADHADALQGVVINGTKLSDFMGKPEPFPNPTPAAYNSPKDLQSEGYWCLAHYIAQTGNTTWIDAFAMNEQAGAPAHTPDTSRVSRGCAAMHQSVASGSIFR